MEEKNCFICNSTQCRISEEDYRNLKIVECDNCGEYITDKQTLQTSGSWNQSLKVLLSHWTRSHQSDKHVELTTNLIEQIKTSFTLPKLKEQCDNLILWLGKSATKPNKVVNCFPEQLVSIIGAYDALGVQYIASHLLEDGIINEPKLKVGLLPQVYALQLTFKGWEKYYELQRTNKDSFLVFMAMQYDNETLQKIYKDVVIDAVKKTGFDIRKLDDVKRAGLIDDKLRVEIRRSKFIIADLSDENRGSYWEAGFAEGLGMTVIYICEEEKFDKLSTHFDTNHNLTIKWKNDTEGLKKFADELKATIRETFPAEAKMED
ncbi:MAG: hypothetical protein WCS69_11620 [Ignavibacteriaceae bacterium]|jgi:hypothetical protein